MTFDVVQAVREGKGHYELAPVTSCYKGHQLRIWVFRDAMKFDDLPELAWDFKVLDEKKRYNGVRLPASAYQLQQIADLTGCLLLTPKVVDLIWLQAGVRFDPVISSGPPNHKIVAISPITQIHQLIEAEVARCGDNGGIVDCVGKHWVLTKALHEIRSAQGVGVRCFNYGWADTNAPRHRKGVTSGETVCDGVVSDVRVWQPVASAHTFHHSDPSQVIRLMYSWAKLLRRDSEDWQDVLLADILQDPELAPLVSHEGVLPTLRQPGVPSEKKVQFMPVMEISGETP